MTTSREPQRDNPWVLVGLGALAVFAFVVGCAAWTWILDGSAR